MKKGSRDPRQNDTTPQGLERRFQDIYSVVDTTDLPYPTDAASSLAFVQELWRRLHPGKKTG